MNNDQRIAEITSRCELATPGPWEWRYNSRNDYGVEAESLKGVITLEDIYPGYPECGEHLVMDIGTPDADFIAHAREDIPYLLSQLAERDKELKRLQKEVASLAIESIEREKTLARLEAEVMAAIDAVPVVRGEWIVDECDATDDESGLSWVDFHCSECSMDYGLEEGQYGWCRYEKIPYQYCPNCGAKMEVKHE